MYTKADVFNLAKGMLLLTNANISNPETDNSIEARVMRNFWDIAWSSTLEDLNLSSTMSQANLELLAETPNNLWAYAYKYPTDCAFFCRIQSGVVVDGEATHIEKVVRQYEGEKAIFTNVSEAIGEYHSTSLSISQLSANAVLALAAKLAWLSSPLITGKGADKLKLKIFDQYKLFKSEAQDQDRRENENYMDPYVESSFVNNRMV